MSAVVETEVSVASLHAEIAALKDEAARRQKFIDTMLNVVEYQGIAMQAAVLELDVGGGAEAGIQRIINALIGPGLLPDEDEVKKDGGIEQWIEQQGKDSGVPADMLERMLRKLPVEPPLETEIDALAVATNLAARARAAGFVLRIDQQSNQPPAMGDHVDVVTVYRARGAA